MIKRIYLEITNSCNLNCNFCEATKKNDFMTLDNIKKNLYEINQVTDYVYMHILGEPLSHPFFNEILDYTDNLNMKVQLVTNGTLLYKYSDIFRHHSIRKLSISIHSIDTVNINSSYFDTIDKLIKQDRNDNQYLELRFYGFDTLKNNALFYYKRLKDEFNFEDTTKKNSLKIFNNTYIYIQDFFHWPNINDPFISDKGKCLGAINMLGILVNGDVVMCCLDPNGHTKIGNIYNKRLIDIINSELYKNLIDDMKKGKLTSPLCQKCTYRLRFNK